MIYQTVKTGSNLNKYRSVKQSEQKIFYTIFYDLSVFIFIFYKIILYFDADICRYGRPEEMKDIDAAQ